MTFAGPDLSRLVVGGPDQRVKLFVPREDGPTAGIAPGAATWRDALAGIPEHLQPHRRTYTIRAHDPRSRTIDIDFALHDPGGPASRWARDAGPGDRLDMLGPVVARNGGYLFEPPADRRLLLVGDQAALPAIGAIVESLPANARGHAFVSVPDKADRQRLAAPPGMEVTWLPRAGGAELREAVAATSLPRGETYAWLGGETSRVREVQRHLATERGLGRGSVAFMGYWRVGHTEDARLAAPPARPRKHTQAAALGMTAPPRRQTQQRPARTALHPGHAGPDPELRPRPGLRTTGSTQDRAHGLELSLGPG